MSRGLLARVLSTSERRYSNAIVLSRLGGGDKGRMIKSIFLIPDPLTPCPRPSGSPYGSPLYLRKTKLVRTVIMCIVFVLFFFSMTRPLPLGVKSTGQLPLGAQSTAAISTAEGLLAGAQILRQQILLIYFSK